MPEIETTPAGTARPSARAQMMAFALLLFSTHATQAQDDAPEPKTRATALLEPFCVLPESYEMRPEVFVLVPGALRIGFTLVRQTPSGLEAYTRSELRDLGLTWFECFRRGKEAASRHLETLKHEITRDQQKVIQYAHFQSENPLTASIFISPDFRKRFEDTLGKELYVAIPDRFNVFVFPKLSDSIEQVAPKMAILYKEALYPVSREVFELSKEGIRVVGKF